MGRELLGVIDKDSKQTVEPIVLPLQEKRLLGQADSTRREATNPSEDPRIKRLTRCG